MNKSERTQTILKAEETIRRLAVEMEQHSQATSQAEAARERLNEAYLEVSKAVNELNIIISAQKIATGEASDILDQAKKSLEDARKTLTDVSARMSGIETIINEAIDGMKAAYKIIESSSAKSSTAISKELALADKKNEEIHIETAKVLEDHSTSLHSIEVAIEAESGKLSELLTSAFSEAEKQSGEKHNASMRVLEDNAKKLIEIRDRQLSGILSLLRFALVAAILGAVSSIIILSKIF